jgi:hypothetical protein
LCGPFELSNAKDLSGAPLGGYTSVKT